MGKNHASQYANFGSLRLDSIAGTYNGVLPPNVETTLTLNADGTYLLIQSEH